MKKITKLFILAAVLTMALSACGGEPANKLEAVQKAGKIVVGTSADYEPWEYKDENDEFVGIDMEIIACRCCAGRQNRRSDRSDGFHRRTQRKS